jgi:hypothetical protein
MSKIIIGVHGLGNKPPQRLLYDGWKKSIQEGLKAIDSSWSSFNFELFYWADALYEKPLDPRENKNDHPYFDNEKYFPSSGSEKKPPSELRKLMINYIEKNLDKLFLNEDMSINFSFIADKIINHYFKDLELYFSSDCIQSGNTERSVKEVIRERLGHILYKYRRKDIMLVAHSMGSIIAYDTLIHTVPDVEIDTFITLGSPLGLPIIISKIFAEQKKERELLKKVRTPENVRKNWINFSDWQDKVALDHTLGDDFEENSRQVKAVDIYVYNDYETEGKRNPHKSYGYLRTPELAKVMDAYLIPRRLKWLVRLFNRIMY